MTWLDVLLDKVRDQASRGFDEPRRGNFNPRARLDTSQVTAPRPYDRRMEPWSPSGMWVSELDPEAGERERIERAQAEDAQLNRKHPSDLQPGDQSLLLKPVATVTKPNGEKHTFVEPSNPNEAASDLQHQVEGDIPYNSNPEFSKGLDLNLDGLVKRSAELIKKLPHGLDADPKVPDWLGDISGTEVVKWAKAHRDDKAQPFRRSDTMFGKYIGPDSEDKPPAVNMNPPVKFDEKTKDLWRVDMEELLKPKDPFADREPTITPTGAYIDLTKEEYEALNPKERSEVDRNTSDRLIGEAAPSVIDALRDPNTNPEELKAELNDFFGPEEYVNFLKYMDKNPEVTDQMKQILGIREGADNG